MSLLSNLRSLFVYKLVSHVGTLLIVMFLTRSFSPSLLGHYFYFETLLGLLGLVSFGSGGAIEKYVSEGEKPGVWHASGLFVSLLLAIVACIVGIIGVVILDLLPMRFLFWMVIGILFDRIFSYYKHLLRAEKQAARVGLLHVARVMIFALLSYVSIQFGYSVVGVVAAAAVSRGIVLLPAVIFTTTTYTEISKDSVIEILQYGKYFFITVIGTKIFYYADVLVIGVFLSTAKIGYYEVVWRLILAAMVLNGTITRTAFAYLSNASATNDTESITTTLSLCLEYVFVIPIGVLAGSVFIGSDLIATLFTANYESSSLIISVLSFGFIFQSIYILISRALFAIGNVKRGFWPSVLSMAINILLNLVLIKPLGLLGAALATTISYIASSFLYVIVFQKVVTIDIPWRSLFHQITAGIGLGIYVYILRNRLDIEPGISTFSVVISGGFVYLILLLSFPSSRQTLKNILYMKSNKSDGTGSD